MCTASGGSNNDSVGRGSDGSVRTFVAERWQPWNGKATVTIVWYSGIVILNYIYNVIEGWQHST